MPKMDGRPLLGCDALICINGQAIAKCSIRHSF